MFIEKAAPRRRPRQRRSRQTVEAVLDAVVRILARDGLGAVTTNRVAEVAGVSVGSIYQYFPDKQALFVALHDRHAEQMGRLVEGTLIAHAASPLEEIVVALLDALVDAHATDPELYEALSTQVPHRSAGGHGLEERLRGALRLAISAERGPRRRPRDLDRTSFVAAHLVNALAHGAVVRRPPGISLEAAKAESVRAILAYLHA